MSAPDSTARALGLPYRTRKVKHRKLTAAQWAALEAEADLRMTVRRNKVLAAELGVSELYIAQVMCRLLAERRGTVPRLTHSFSLRGQEDKSEVPA